MDKEITVLLANPPWYTENKMGMRAGSRCPASVDKDNPSKRFLDYLPFPFMLAYAAAILEENNINVRVIDAIAEGLKYEEFIERTIKHNPKIIVIETSTPTIISDLTVAANLKRDIKGCCIVLCGSHASNLASELLTDNRFIDYIMRGEYEETLPKLVEAIGKHDGFGKVKGISYRNRGKIINNLPRSLLDINKLPYPAWHLLPMLGYKEAFLNRYPQAKVQTSRGCPYNCNFCLWGDTMFGGRNYRVRSPKDVIDEVETLVERYGMKAIYFDDDTFNLDKRRVIDICDEIISRAKLRKVAFSFIGRADLIDEAVLSKLRKANFVFALYGVESGNQRLIDECGKSLDLEKAKKMIRLTKKMGIGVHLTFAVGLYNETWKTVMDTKRFIKETNPDSIQVQYVIPYPGTRYFSQLDKEGFILTKDWGRYDNSEPVIRTRYMGRGDLIKAREYLKSFWERHFFLHNFYKPRYMIKALIHPVKAARISYSNLRALIGV